MLKELSNVLLKDGVYSSFLAGVLGFEPRMSVPKTNALPLGYTPLGGGGYRDRTCYLLNANQALSQMS